MQNPYRLEEREDAWVLSLKAPVTNVRIGTGFDVQLLDGAGRVEISIGNLFRLVQGCVVQEFDPDKFTTLGPALSMVRKTIEQAVAYKNGRLRLEFSDGSLITAGPHPQYEAWQISGWDAPGTMLIVCTPGGGLAVWDGEK